jgi:hypothetical protein
VLVANACNPNNSGGREQFKASLDKWFVRPYLKNIQHNKSSGRVAQECLPSKCEALSSNPSTASPSKYYFICFQEPPNIHGEKNEKISAWTIRKILKYIYF